MTYLVRNRMAQWLSGRGLEIGALHDPLPVPRGVSVSYVDRLPADELRRHYPELADRPLAPVSILGDACDLSSVADDSQDFVIANHLLEHLEDPLRGLREMTRVLRPGGLLYVALPDPRLSFDRARPVTTVEHILEEFRSGTESTRRAHYEQWVDLVEWRTGADRDARVRELMEMGYSIHFHVLRPETWLELLTVARRELGLALELVAFETTTEDAHHEYISVLAKGDLEAPAARPAPLRPRASVAQRLTSKLRRAVGR